MQLSDRTTQTLMAVIATILIVAALRATQSISMPLAFAFFIAVLVDPLRTAYKGKRYNYRRLLL